MFVCISKISSHGSHLFGINLVALYIQDFEVKQGKPITLHCDDQATLHIDANLIFHEQTKHIEINCHIVHEKLLPYMISTFYIPPSLQLANIFIQAL